MAEETVISIEMLLSYKRNIRLITYNSMNEFQIQYVKLKKPFIKGCILYDLINMAIWKEQNHRDKSISVPIKN